MCLKHGNNLSLSDSPLSQTLSVSLPLFSLFFHRVLCQRCATPVVFTVRAFFHLMQQNDLFRLKKKKKNQTAYNNSKVMFFFRTFSTWEINNHYTT